MKYCWLFAFCIGTSALLSQQLQLHYDLRHTVDPKHTAKNFPTLYFEYFKGADSGAFLLKLQSDFNGDKNNMGQAFLQVQQSLRYWKPKLQLHLGYSAGLGIAEPNQFGYYIHHAFLVGAAYPFQEKQAWFNLYAAYKYSPFDKASHDVQCGFW